MDKQQSKTSSDELSGWLSTYGLITLEKIFDRYYIKLQPDDLIRAFKNKDCLLFKLVQVPIKNIFNGLIFQQAKDYETYAQKLYIDYLLSGQGNDEGSSIQEDLEMTRKELIQMGESFQDLEINYEKSIAVSQQVLIQYARGVNERVFASAKKLKEAFQKTALLIQDEKVIVHFLYSLLTDFDDQNQLPDTHLAWGRGERILGQSFDQSIRPLIRQELVALNVIPSDITAELEGFAYQAADIENQFKQFRAQFSAIIVKTNELLYLLSDYHVDQEKQVVNQEDLNFNASLGDEDRR